MDFTGVIQGLHHVTATVNDAQEDYDFYTRTLGLRLVKETVNFDNERVYHFYYANKVGTPSTVFTTFPYQDQGVRAGKIGAGQVTQTAFSVPTASMDFWAERLARFSVPFTRATLFGHPVLNFPDPSGLLLQLIGTDADEREPVWTFEAITLERGIRGIHHVHLLVQDGGPTRQFLERFGYRVVQNAGELTLFEAGAGGPGNRLILEADAHAPRGLNGLGTVHHVAHRVASTDDSQRIRNYLESEFGFRVTEILDRKYFQSIYFRIPGGILFEVATVGPGFLVDEDEPELGTALKLPDWQEPRRAQIEANLRPFER